MTGNQTTDDQVTEDQQLTALFAQMCDAWTRGDAQAYGDCFTTDCDYVSFDGTRAQGRASMVDAHDKLFRGVLSNTALVGDVESIRHLDNDVALLYGTGSVLVAWRSRLPKRRLTRNTIIALRRPEGWRFTAIHNSRVRPMNIPEPNSFPARMARLLVWVSQALGIGCAAQPANRRSTDARDGTRPPESLATKPKDS